MPAPIDKRYKIQSGGVAHGGRFGPRVALGQVDDADLLVALTQLENGAPRSVTLATVDEIDTVSAAAMAIAYQATLTGSTSAAVGTPVTYTVTLNGEPPDGLEIIPTSTGGGTFGPVVTVNSKVYTFTHTAAANGTYTIGITTSPALTTNTITLTVADPVALTATVTFPSVVELYKPYTVIVELNQPAPGSYEIDVMKGGVRTFAFSLKTGEIGESYKDVIFTTAAPETLDVVIKRASSVATHPLPTKVGAPVTVTKVNATRLDLLGAKGGKPNTWVRFAVQPNGPIQTACSAVLFATEGTDQTTVYPSTVSWAAGEVGRKEFWVYRHSAGNSKLRLVNSSSYPIVNTDTLIFGDGSWADRAFRNSVLFHHNFAADWEVDQFSKAEPTEFNAPARVSTSLGGWALTQKTVGSLLVEDVPACPSYYLNKSTPEVARQVWRVSDLSEWPDGPYPFDVHVGLKGSEVGEGGGTRNLEIVRVESLNYETNEITLLRRTTGSSYGYMGVSYGGGSTATTAAALLAIHEIRIGTDSTGAWERFMCAKRINGIRDDIGITNGAAVKPRDWPPFKANGERVTTRGDRTTHFLQGYWGHRSYWNPAYGVAEYKDWVPPNPVNSNNYVRTDVFEGQSVWIQFRSKLNANRILLGTAKHFFIQNDMSGHGQFVWNAGGDPDNVRPDGRGSRLVPYTQYNDSAAHEPSTLVMPPSWPGEVTKDNSTFGYRVHHQEDYPLATYPTLTSADAGWRFPGNVWVTYMIHFDFGRDNAVQPWVDYNTNLAANRAQEKVPEPAAYDADYRTEIKVFVAEPGDTKWKRIIDYPSYAWMFGDDKNHAGHYQQNPPGLSMLQFGSFGNIYIGSGGQPPPKGTTAVEFTDIIVSREPLPIPDVGVMPSDYIPEPAVPPSFTPSPPAPATGHYTDGMQPFEVRQLTGAYAPLGAATFRASQPPPWNGSARFQTEGIISAWSGGVYDPTTKRLFFSGGGHSDGANNGWHVFDWSGTTRPLGFYTLEGSRSEGSALDSIVSYWRVGAYADGKPNAVHTYSNVVYSQSRRRIYRGNSSSWPDVNNGQVPLAPSGFYWFDEDTGTYGNYPIDINDTGGILILSPDESKIFANRPLSGTDNGFFDMSTGAFTSFSISLFSGSWDPSYCYDPTRNRYLLVGYNSPTLVVYLLSINWAANTATKTQVSLASHAGILSAAMGIVYDEQEDCFWALGGKESTGGVITQIARIDAETLEASAFPLSTPIPKNAVGQYGRIAWLQEHRAIGLVAAHDQPAAVVKLP